MCPHPQCEDETLLIALFATQRQCHQAVLCQPLSRSSCPPLSSVRSLELGRVCCTSGHGSLELCCLPTSLPLCISLSSCRFVASSVLHSSLDLIMDIVLVFARVLRAWLSRQAHRHCTSHVFSG